MFWKRYVNLCSERGESPNAVAQKCGVVSSGTVTGWKNGANPRPLITNKLAAYFGVDPEYLLGKTSLRVKPPLTHYSEVVDVNQPDLFSVLTSLRDDHGTRTLLQVYPHLTPEQVEKMAEFGLFLRNQNQNKSENDAN